MDLRVCGGGAWPVAKTLTPENFRALKWTLLSAGIGAVIALAKNAAFHPNTRNKLLNILERAAWSFIQGAIGVLPATLSLQSGNDVRAYAQAAFSGGIAALLSFAKNLTAGAASDAPTSTSTEQAAASSQLVSLLNSDFA